MHSDCAGCCDWYFAPPLLQIVSYNVSQVSLSSPQCFHCTTAVFIQQGLCKRPQLANGPCNCCARNKYQSLHGCCGKPGAQHCAHCHLQLSRMAQVRGRQASCAQPPQMLRVSKLEGTCCWLTSNPCRCRRCDGGSDACLLLTYTRWAWTRCMPETGHVSADGFWRMHLLQLHDAAVPLTRQASINLSHDSCGCALQELFCQDCRSTAWSLKTRTSKASCRSCVAAKHNARRGQTRKRVLWEYAVNTSVGTMYHQSAARDAARPGVTSSTLTSRLSTLCGTS